MREELIEVDIKAKKILRYCVIEERARSSLYDLYAFKATHNGIIKKGLWFNEQRKSENLE